MVSFLILADGTIVYDEYSTPVGWSRVTLAHTARICWSCLFSYFISELRRGGLWAFPQRSSYSWWSCEFNCTVVDKTIPSTFFGEVDVCELYYWPARVFSRASWRCSSLNLSVASFNMVDLRFMGCVVKMMSLPGEFLLLQCACQLFGLGTSTHVCLQSSTDHYIIKLHGSWLGMGAGPSKLW